jgi:hypothetical protein
MNIFERFQAIRMPVFATSKSAHLAGNNTSAPAGARLKKGRFAKKWRRQTKSVPHITNPKLRP